MKKPLTFCFLPALLLISMAPAFSQYYYKDILGAKEASQLATVYHNNNVQSVVVKTYDGNNVRIDDLLLHQTYSPASRKLVTVSKSAETGASVLSSFFDASGRIIRSTDSSATAVWNTVYSYNAAGQLLSIVIASNDSANRYGETEEHLYEYRGQTPVRMLKIKNRVDTTVVEFKTDEKGNVMEEVEVKKGRRSEPVYYYYDENNRLTDIVRFNPKAGRLLPEYLFEYSPAGQVIQKITVPANSSEYIIWRFQFDQRGLKLKEAVYNKQKQLTGRIEYEYGFSS